MRFVATADWQLGMAARYLDDEARPRYHQARFDAVKRIGQVADEVEAQFVLVGGDTFESNSLDRKVVAKTCEALRAFPVPVVILPANHDPLDAASLFDSPDFLDYCPANVIVLRDSQPVEVVPGVQVVGAPWRSKFPGRDLVAAALEGLEAPPTGQLRVLLGHGAVDSLNPDAGDLATIRSGPLQAALGSGVIHFAVLGDRHGTWEVAPQIWYPGTPEVTHRREIDPGNVLVVDLNLPATPVGSGPGIKEPRVNVDVVPVGSWQFLTLSAQLESGADVAEFLGTLDAVPNKETTAVWLKLTGTLTISQMAQLDDGLARAGELFARLDYWQRHTDLALVADDEDFAGLGLSGFAQDAVDELRTRAGGDGEDAQAAEGALRLLYRFVGQGGAQ